MTLSELNSGESAVIVKVRGRGSFRKRIIEMGFVSGKEVTVIKRAPLYDPIEYEIMGYHVSLRHSEANLIDIAPCGSDTKTCAPYEGVLSSNAMKTSERDLSKIITVALVGNPNCGKTTLFNNASGSSERVGNYSGVTVEAKESSFEYKGYTIKLIDLPGTYSITAYSPEELYVRKFIIDEAPDIVINVIDGSNLERNFYLTTQLIDMDIKVVIALNMYDELLKKNSKFKYDELGKMIGIPMVPTVGSKGTGILELFDKVIQVHEERDPTVRHIHINYGQEIEDAIHSIQKTLRLPGNECVSSIISTRFLAIKLLEKDKDAAERISLCVNYTDVDSAVQYQIARLEKLYAVDSETIVTDAKYGFISGALLETIVPGKQDKRHLSETIDTFLTNRILGFPLFLAFMWLIFQGTFTLGKYPMQLIDRGVSFISMLLSTHMPDGSLKALLMDGIIGGVGGVIVFLPSILILFFFIAFMEDTGYMARAAFIMDKLMHRIGLHGRSFIPLLMGFGCNVPAIMATRTIESRNDRIVTILISPFMSCSARLPVYVIFISAFFPQSPGSMLFFIYLIGIAVAALSAVLLKKTLFRSNDIPFVMELPPYRMPTLRSTFKHMWDKGVQYLKKMGGVILVASILIWALGHYPRIIDFSKDYNSMIQSSLTLYQSSLSAASSDQQKAQLTAQHAQNIKTIERMREAEHQEKSYLGQMGKIIEPVIRPLGFDWRIGISIITGLAAKEIVVSSMGVLFNVDSESDETGTALMQKLKEQIVTSGPRKGEVLFSKLVALSFMIFILLYFPCFATIIAIKNETNSLKWALFSMTYSTLAAWIITFTVYQVGKLIT